MLQKYQAWYSLTYLIVLSMKIAHFSPWPWQINITVSDIYWASDIVLKTFRYIISFSAHKTLGSLIILWFPLGKWGNRLRECLDLAMVPYLVSSRVQTQFWSSSPQITRTHGRWGVEERQLLLCSWLSIGILLIFCFS